MPLDAEVARDEVDLAVVRLAVERQRQGDVAAHAQKAQELAVLRHVADPRWSSGFSSSASRQSARMSTLPKLNRAALVRCRRQGHHLQQRALPAAGRAHEAHPLARRRVRLSTSSRNTRLSSRRVLATARSSSTGDAWLMAGT